MVHSLRSISIPLFFVLLLAATNVRADEPFGEPELTEISGPIAEGLCETSCATANWLIESVPLPSATRDRLQQGDSVFLVTGQGAWECGAGRCTIAYVLRSDDELIAIWSEAGSIRTIPLQPDEIPAIVERGNLPRLQLQSLARTQDTPSVESRPISPVFPLGDSEARVNTAFGAAGPGTETDPSTYFSGQYHAAVDLRAAKDEPVFAPFAGTIVYEHRLSGAGEARWLQSFFVLRDNLGRDWIFGHVDCTVCSEGPLIGDDGAWPKAAEVPVSPGQEIGRIADLSVEGFGSHLHLGLSTLPVVDKNGKLLASYRAGNWARLLYEQGSVGALEAAAAQGVALGFVDPLSVLRRDHAASASAQEIARTNPWPDNSSSKQEAFIQLPPVTDLLDGRAKGSVTLLDRGDTVFAWRGETFGGQITAQAALLAGLLKAPSKYAPTNNLQRAQDRANVIIGLMEEQGFLSPAEADNARTNPAQLSEAAQTKSGGFFADWVMETAPSFLTSETMEDVVIRTTLDQALQRKAEEALDWVFENKIKSGSNAQAAIVVMSADGAVRAMVGGRKIEAAGSFNRATQALRQTGSSFKPFVYAAARDLGWSPMDFVEDTPLTIDIPGSGPWTPKNYDGEFKGMITLSQALAESRNIPAVRVAEAVGREAVRKIAADFGIASDMAAGPALALGASESTLIEMTGAYAGILNGGSSVTPYGIRVLEVPGNDALNMITETGIGERVIREEAAQLLVYMMSQVVENGTGTRARLDGRPAAGKTGTTTAGRDAWFIGFTGDYVAGVWMGYDDNTPLKGVTGGGLPAEIWHEVMTRVHDGLPATALLMIVPEPAFVEQPTLGVEQALDEALGGHAPRRDPIGDLLNDILRGN